jgi:hypothetical protein
MYLPNFCVECGERLPRRGWRALLIRAQFCGACNRRMGRIGRTKSLAIISIIAVAAFAIGRCLRPPAPPLIIQRAANSPLSDLPLNLNDSARPSARQDSIKQNAENLNPTSATDDNAYICGARTKKGTPCHRRVHAAGERCFQHKGMPPILPLDKLVVKSK